MEGWSERAREMVDRQIRARGVKDRRVLDAILRVPRHLFVPDENRSHAYEDRPLPIGSGQTISQPYMVALMTELLSLKGDEKVLEVGTGSGYQAALLCELCKEVYSVERIAELAERARKVLERLGYVECVKIKVGDGSKGWKEYAPYDAVIVTASAPDIPSSLVEQLASPGRLVIPVGDRYMQDLLLLEKDAKGELHKKSISGCVFVPLIGEEGWKGGD